MFLINEGSAFSLSTGSVPFKDLFPGVNEVPLEEVPSPACGGAAPVAQCWQVAQIRSSGLLLDAPRPRMLCHLKHLLLTE